MEKLGIVAFVLATMFVGAPALAEEPETEESLVVSGDRPSFSTGASVVPSGHVQFELGADVGTTDGGAILTLPQLFVRAGAGEVAEFRLGIPSYAAGLGVDDPGVGTTELSIKLAGDVSESLSVGVLPFLRFADYGGDIMDQASLGFLGLWGAGLTDMFGLFGNAGLASVPAEDGTTTFEYALSLGGTAAFTDAFGTYLEAFVTQADSDPNVGINGGATYLIVSWLAVDAYVGAGLAGGVSEVFGGAGVSLLQ